MSNTQLSRRAFVGIAAAAPVTAAAAGQWINLFDGATLAGWQPSENKSSWTVRDGALTADGPRSHLFYTGPVNGALFRNFELEVEVVTQPDCNSGVYFHTAYQESGFPNKGFEIQVNNTANGEKGYLERKKTGSLYGLRNMYKQLVPDGPPFRLHVSVRGKNVQIHVNDELLVDYVEPTPPVIPEGGEPQRFLDRGTFALQCHNLGSRVVYRQVRVRPLPDNLLAYVAPPPTVDIVYRQIINIGRHNIPLVDYHVSLSQGMTLEQALAKSRSDGIQYGIAKTPAELKSDAGARHWSSSLTGKPVFSALCVTDTLQSSGISRKTAQSFDYILADNRLWNNSQDIDVLLNQIVQRLQTEPVDILAFPTYLPPQLRPKADDLWTEPRMARLIEALVKNQVAIELNSRELSPSRTFIERARQAGCKFAFGTANQSSEDLRRCEYGLQMVEACNLDWHDFFVPGAWQPKAADRRWFT